MASHDYLSSLFRSPQPPFFPGVMPGNSPAEDSPGQDIERFIRGVLGPRDENDVFTRGDEAQNATGQNSSSPFGNLDPQMILGLLVDMVLNAQNQARPQARSMPANGGNWSSGAPVPGGWSGGGGGTGSAPVSSGPSGTTTRSSGPTPATPPGNAAEPFKGGTNVVPRQGDFSGIQGSSGCGPLAAIGLARSLGMNPDIQQTFDLASQMGWGAEGMGGPGNYQKLLEGMGIAARLEYDVNAQAIQESVEDGKPVTLSTARHYFLATDYDPSTGKYFVGNSGTALSGGKEWMSLDEINALGDGINGVIYPS
jgi:hypothetical protein